MLTHQLKKGSLKEVADIVDKPSSMSTACRIRARNDAEAIERWLDEYFDKPTTFRTYKKESERFLVWCVRQRYKNLANLHRDDVEAYITFLKNPLPKEYWCGPRRKKLNKDEEAIWYPFAGPLSESAIKTALASLNSLMAYLVDARYLDFNPFSLVRKKNRFKQNIDERAFSIHERILHEDEWRALVSMMEEEPEVAPIDFFKKQRLRFLIACLFYLGLRVDELARAQWCDCKKFQGKWWFFVKGKGDRLGKIPINSHLLQAIMHYRHSLKKAPLPDTHDASPLIHSFLNDTKTLSVRQISNILKALAIKTAMTFTKDSPSHEKLLRFSPHWLRHLSASRQDLAGISFTNIMSNLRHQNESTTRLYVHAEDDLRHQEMEKLRI